MKKQRITFLLAGALTLLIGFSSPFIPSAIAAETERAVPDITGYWARPEPARGAAVFYPLDNGPVPVTFSAEAGEARQGMPYIGDDMNPILLPHAAEAVRAQREAYRRGDAVWSAWALCWPTGEPTRTIAVTLPRPWATWAPTRPPCCCWRRWRRRRRRMIGVTSAMRWEG